MERVTVEKAKSLFGNNFIGKEELQPLFARMGFGRLGNIEPPEIPYTLSELVDCAQDYLLILGIPRLNEVELNILAFLNSFGVDPFISEPCFYNQDWYLKEDFIVNTLDFRWYLLKKEVVNDSRAVLPEMLITKDFNFPSAILCTFAFFAYYYWRKEYLWYHDFVWCSDLDHNGDRIYVGKYHDVDGINKNGFSIHRHLALRSCYGAVVVK